MLAAGQIHGGSWYRAGAWGQYSDSSQSQALVLDLPCRAEHVPNITSRFRKRPPTNPLGVKGIGERDHRSLSCMVHAVLDALQPFGITHPTCL